MSDSEDFDFEKFKLKRELVQGKIIEIAKRVDVLSEKEEVTSKDVDELRIVEDVLSKKDDELTEICNTIHLNLKISELAADVAETDSMLERVCQTKNQIRKLKGKANKVEERENSNNVQIPKIQITTYSGKLEEYTTFRQTFGVTIDQNKKLSKIEKFIYLQSYLEGRAKDVLSGLAVTEANYETAKEILDQNFGGKEKIKKLHIQRIINIPKIKDINQVFALRQNVQTLTTNLRSLQNLDMSTEELSAVLLPLTKDAFPIELRLQFEREEDEQKKNIETFVQLMDREVRLREQSTSQGLDPMARPFRPRPQYQQRPFKRWIPRRFPANLPQQGNVPRYPPMRVPVPEPPRHNRVPEQGNHQANAVRCFKCNGIGHYKSQCPQTHRI
ncbi:hypothetical protein RF55_11296 [Lasius niger]|uniref:CCHC-type domain-containing protein n=1 Tax=Lasius niger TaxID=67767 RepID=A0A0J7KFR0_LASNI|nr:hypothetical protein RF55_11296 [Lasius niger]